MTKTIHHPQDELLAAYSAASLPLSQALCVSTHLEHCQLCHQNLQRLEQLGSELMFQLKPAKPSADLLKKIISSLEKTGDPSEKEKPEHEAKSSIPRCLRQFVPDDYRSLSWQRISPSIQSHELCRDTNGAKVELLRIKPGGSATTHTHMGDEYTVILEGSFSDEDGRYNQGDFLVRNETHQHTPVATLDAECICLAVTEAPIQLTGFFSRWLNPLLRRSYG